MRSWLELSVIISAALIGCANGGGGVGGSGGGTTSSTTTSSSSTTTTTGTGGTGGEGGLPAGKCRTSTDCKGGEQCAPPGATLPCGACNNDPNECGADFECTQSATAICDPVPCACSGQKKCVEGCTTDTACGPGRSCGTDHRCAPMSCAQQLDCPTNFICPPITLPHCERRTCSVDAECDVGYCVAGECFDMPGTCTPPVP